MIQTRSSASVNTNDTVKARTHPTRVGIFYPADPAGHIPGGIDTIIRGILKWAPEDIDYTLFGATSDPEQRPVGQEASVSLGNKTIRFIPIVSADPSGRRKLVPLTIRYMLVLRRYIRQGRLDHLDILDFHRVEPLALFRKDHRPKNVMIHQDMEVIRSKDADIGWRYAPWLYEAVERRLFRKANHVFCVRQSAVARYRRVYADSADRFSFIPTWVDTTIFHPLQDTSQSQNSMRMLDIRFGVSQSAQLLVWVGRLDRQKDPVLLLDAIKVAVTTQPEIHLLMIGDGILRQQIEAQIKSLELAKHVTLCGAIPPSQIAEILQIADLFVLSSAYEGMPIVVLEALASGVPVVTTEVGEVRLVIDDGIDGFVVTERSPDALGGAICNALSLGDAIRGHACIEAVDAYTPERVLQNIYDNHRAQAAQRHR
jgi:glycosyltransferase involved in cell wall biosynthesis